MQEQFENSDQDKIAYALQCLDEGNLSAFKDALIEIAHDHPAAAEGYRNVASNLFAQGKYEAAEPLAVFAVEIAFKSLGKDHAHTQSFQETLAEIRLKLQ